MKKMIIPSGEMRKISLTAINKRTLESMYNASHFGWIECTSHDLHEQEIEELRELGYKVEKLQNTSVSGNYKPYSISWG